LLNTDWRKALCVDTWRYNSDRQIFSTSLTSFGSGVSARGNDVLSAAQHTRKNLFRTRQSSWHCYLGTMQNHYVRKFERWANDAKWNRWIENYEICANFFCHFVDALNHPRMRKQNRFLRSPNEIRLLRIKFCSVFVWRSKYSKRIWWKPAPPLPQQVLNSTNLWWEIVRDKKVFHGRRSHQYLQMR
jgi:hypothetical protein